MAKLKFKTFYMENGENCCLGDDVNAFLSEHPNIEIVEMRATDADGWTSIYLLYKDFEE